MPPKIQQPIMSLVLSLRRKEWQGRVLAQLLYLLETMRSFLTNRQGSSSFSAGVVIKSPSTDTNPVGSPTFLF